MMKKARFGIVGTGRISDWVLKGAVLDPRFEAAAVCSRSEENAKVFASKHGIPATYTELDEMLSDESLDAIYIGTPNFTHHDIAIRSMERGKNVLCEKPLASNAREVEDMTACARKNGVLLMEAMISPLNPNFRNARKHIRGIGPVRHWNASFCQYSSKMDLLKKIVSGASDSPLPSSMNPDAAGGATLDVGIYTIYPMVVLFGEPSTVKADLITMEVPTSEGLKKIDIQGNVLFTYPGMQATVAYSKMANSRLRTEISGDGGIISMDAVHITRNVSLTRRGAPTSGRSSGPLGEDITVPVDADEYLCEFKEFIDLLQSGRKESDVNSLENSLLTARVMDEIRRQGGVRFPMD